MQSVYCKMGIAHVMPSDQAALLFDKFLYAGVKELIGEEKYLNNYSWHSLFHSCSNHVSNTTCQTEFQVLRGGKKEQ